MVNSDIPHDREHDDEAEAVAISLEAAPDMEKALRGVCHHNDNCKPEYQLPESLMRQVRATLAPAVRFSEPA